MTSADIYQVETTLSPDNLLNVLQSIEKDLGRKKVIDKGPRNIDLDILLYSDWVINEKRLKVPHPLMYEREFVLRPLAE
jgi:2-amino-4-hydroxy-6-hydroxymethyldihydropteridine diphosphokinase/dihydropteroate synthase